MFGKVFLKLTEYDKCLEMMGKKTAVFGISKMDIKNIKMRKNMNYIRAIVAILKFKYGKWKNLGLIFNTELQMYD